MLQPVPSRRPERKSGRTVSNEAVVPYEDRRRRQTTPPSLPTLNASPSVQGGPA